MKKIDYKTIDAEGRTLGRVASEVATILMGKNKPTFERHVYSGFPVEVVNASKLEKKGLKELIRLATYQMLPDNKLRREMMKHLKIED